MIDQFYYLACETLGVLSSIFGLFEPFLPKIDSMQTMQIDIKYH